MGKDREPRALYAREAVAARVFACRQLSGVMVSFATMSAMKMNAREDFWRVRHGYVLCSYGDSRSRS